MAIVAGVDGCKDGWVVVYEDTERSVIQSIVVKRIEHVFDQLEDLAILAIDIPIGLSDDGPRACDTEAKVLLGDRRSSVFHAPRRSWLAAVSHADAVAIARSQSAPAPSIQSWCITPKIREVDHLLRTRLDLRYRVFEVHPEISFTKMAGAPMRHGKKNRAGKGERMERVATFFGETTFRSVRSLHPTKRLVGDDDILDAFAALWTARRIYQGAAGSLPTIPLLDVEELPMRMMF